MGVQLNDGRIYHGKVGLAAHASGLSSIACTVGRGLGAMGPGGVTQ